VDYFAEGSPTSTIDAARACALLGEMCAQLAPLRRVLLLPPDYTRVHSGAGALTVALYELLRERSSVEIMPTLGTHLPMTAEQRKRMFPGIPAGAFHVHDWRGDLVTLGEVPADFVRELTGGRVEFPITCAINRRIVDGNWDCIISIGQLVPHEVAGIANHAKNVFVGTGGADAINKTHFIGAVCGMEKAMGRSRTPVRAVLDYMREQLAAHLPINYVLTVRGHDDVGQLVTRGLFAGDDSACFERGAALCREVNVTLLAEPIRNAIVYLDPAEYRSTWLGNKAIYRLRMAMADGGTLLIVAPGVETFGEDARIDRLIRRHGYRGTPHVLAAVHEDGALAQDLAAAAHLIHGSSEGRFEIVYAPGRLSRAEIETVGFGFADPDVALAKCESLTPGWDELAGERVFFVANPGLGLWALRERFECGAPGVGG
jgi:nickel-dependent lactate racemase